jgi:protein O-mannosyl-transferase
MPVLTSNRHMTRALSILALCAITIAAFWPALSGGFIFDDYSIFVENPVVHISGWHWQAWHALWTWSLINIQRPLVMFTYALNYALGGSTWGFKTTNLALHLLNAMLVWLLANRLLAASWNTPSDNINNSDRQRTQYWALAVATAWAVHPLQLSAVMYVVQRMEVMGFTFVLLAVLCYWRARQQQQLQRRAWPWLLFCAFLVCVGYCAKETAVLVPGYALLLELTILRFAASSARTTRLWKIFYACGCALALAIFFGYLLPRYATAAAYDARDFTAWQRELTQLRVLPMYLGWSLVPLPNLLHFYYDNYPASSSLLHPATTLLGGLFLVALLGLAFAVRHRRPLLAFGIGWFFMAHALTSSPLPLELVFEHRNYPALFGVLLALADVVWLACRRVSPSMPAIIALVFIFNLGFLTFLRAETWSSPLQLATTLASYNPGSARAALDLARRYVAISGDNPDVPAYWLGIRELERAARLPGSSILPEDALLIQAANHPGLDSGVWWDSLREKLRTRPMGPETYLALNGLLHNRLYDHVNIDATQLARAYDIAIARQPNLDRLHIQYAELAGIALQNPTVAIEQWQDAMQVKTHTPSYVAQLANYLIEGHRNREALAVIEKAQAVQPALLNDATLLALRQKAQKGVAQQPTTSTGG